MSPKVQLKRLSYAARVVDALLATSEFPPQVHAGLKTASEAIHAARQTYVVVPAVPVTPAPAHPE